MPFDLRDSNLPLLIAFPLLMANMLDWFSARRYRCRCPMVCMLAMCCRYRRRCWLTACASPCPMALSAICRSRAIRWHSPETTQLGLYRLEVLQAGEVLQAQAFAVNMFGAGESDIRPAPEADLQLKLGGGTLALADEDQLGLREFWTLFALAALLLLIIEWIVYHRRLQVPTLLRGAPGPLRSPWQRLRNSLA